MNFLFNWKHKCFFNFYGWIKKKIEIIFCCGKKLSIVHLFHPNMLYIRYISPKIFQHSTNFIIRDTYVLIILDLIFKTSLSIKPHTYSAREKAHFQQYGFSKKQIKRERERKINCAYEICKSECLCLKFHVNTILGDTKKNLKMILYKQFLFVCKYHSFYTIVFIVLFTCCWNHVEKILNTTQAGVSKYYQWDVI